MPLGLPPLRIGLAASALHRAAPNGALFRLLGPLEQSIREELRAELFVLGTTYDALVADGVLADYPRLTRLPARRDGGLIHLVAAVVSCSSRHSRTRGNGSSLLGSSAASSPTRSSIRISTSPRRRSR